MAITPSNMMPLGTIAPNFSLRDTVSGDMKSLQDLRSDKATVVMFICNHCPFVVHIAGALGDVARKYTEHGVQFIAISSNDAEAYPQDGPDKMKLFFEAQGYHFPYLYDESQAVAKAYNAACTPDFYVFDGDLKCVYRGQFDASRPGNEKPVTGACLREALDAALVGEVIPESAQRPSQGCNIKWRR